MMNSVESGENPCSELVIPHYEFTPYSTYVQKLDRVGQERGVNQTSEPPARIFSEESLH